MHQEPPSQTALVVASGSSLQLSLPPRTRETIIEKAFLSREVENLLLDLFYQGRIFGTVHTCIGQEFVGATISQFLREEDAVFSNHRCHGHYLSYTGDVVGLIGEVMGRSIGTCQGLGGSQHICRGNFFSNGIQGGIVPISAGLAMARKLKGQSAIATVFIGDGTLGQGVVYETFNLAAKLQLPLLVVLENNRIAQSTPQELNLAGDILSRAQAFDWTTEQGNTWEWESLYQKAGRLIQGIRNGHGPAFLCVDTFRLKAHSKGDDTRPREIITPYEEKDPLNRLSENPAYATIREKVRIRVESALQDATASPPSSLQYLHRMSAPATVQLKPYQLNTNHKNLGQALNAAFHKVMKEQERVLFIGEDVADPYGGAFKISKGLSTSFPDQVFTTPISEAAITGLGNGLALAGYKPFVEIMFGDFITLAFDQLINHSAKFEAMYAQQVRCPLVLRTPMGGGRGYGPTHSQTLDRHLLGTPGLKVLSLNAFSQGQELIEQLAKESAPTVLLEHKGLYNQPPYKQVPGFELLQSENDYPTYLLRPCNEEAEVTLICSGGPSAMISKLIDVLFEEHDLLAQAIVPTQLYPFDASAIAPLIKGRLVFVEEGQGFAGFASEVISQLAQLRALPGGVRRVNAEAVVIPSSKDLESQVLPGEEDILEAILGL